MRGSDRVLSERNLHIPMHGAEVDRTCRICRRPSSWASIRSKDGGTGPSQVREIIVQAQLPQLLTASQGLAQTVCLVHHMLSLLSLLWLESSDSRCRSQALLGGRQPGTVCQERRTQSLCGLECQAWIHISGTLQCGLHFLDCNPCRAVHIVAHFNGME